MRKRKPLTDEEGEVRELLLEDLERFRPIAEVVPVSLIAKLGIENAPAHTPAAKPRVARKPRIKAAGLKTATRKAPRTRRRATDPVR